MSVSLKDDEHILFTSMLYAIPIEKGKHFTVEAVRKKAKDEGRIIESEDLKKEEDQRETNNRITHYLKENGFAIDRREHPHDAILGVLLLTFHGRVLCAYGSLHKYFEVEASQSTREEIISCVPDIIAKAFPYGEFTIEWQPQFIPRIININPSTTEGEEQLQNLADAFNSKKRIIDEYEGRKKNEEILQFLVGEGFAINRHDIGDKTILYRQLTDKGRELKECGSIEAYHAKIDLLRAGEEEERTWRKETSRRQHRLAEKQMELSQNQYIVNIWIALSTGVVAVLGFFQMFDYYYKHTLNWQMIAYFSTGLGVGLLIWLIVWQLLKLLRKQKS